MRYPPRYSRAYEKFCCNSLCSNYTAADSTPSTELKTANLPSALSSSGSSDSKAELPTPIPTTGSTVPTVAASVRSIATSPVITIGISQLVHQLLPNELLTAYLPCFPVRALSLSLSLLSLSIKFRYLLSLCSARDLPGRKSGAGDPPPLLSNARRVRGKADCSPSIVFCALVPSFIDAPLGSGRLTSPTASGKLEE